VTTTIEPLPDEAITTTGDAAAFTDLLRRLSHQSVTKHFDAYADVAWDEPGYEIDPSDPRWELPESDGLGATAWYRGLPQQTRARIGLDRTAEMMKTGLQFESVLKRGLLEFASELPNRSPEFRYAYHEVIEEAQHSLMFQEFVNRSGADPTGLRRTDKIGARFVIGLGRRFPPLFFVFVLGGEDPIDHVQRRELRSGAAIHPLLERIMRIHVTEEARHLSFARHYLKTQMPTLGRFQRIQLGIGAPLILAAMAQMMLQPSSELVRRYRIPPEVLKEAYTKNPGHEAGILESLGKVRRLCSDLGLLGPGYRLLWRAFGLWAEDIDGD
jgi:para-aminobenzoate N-oxygenase AurF